MSCRACVLRGLNSAAKGPSNAAFVHRCSYLTLSRQALPNLGLGGSEVARRLQRWIPAVLGPVPQRVPRFAAVARWDGFSTNVRCGGGVQRLSVEQLRS